VYADIRWEFPWAEASNDSGVVDDGNFWTILVSTSLETLQIRPALLHGDMLPLVGQ